MSDMSGLVLVGKTMLGGKTYTVNDSNGTILKKAMGVPDHWYGGTVKEFRKVKDSGILMCLDRRDRVINLAYRYYDLTDGDRELLGLVRVELKEVPEQDEGNMPICDSITDDTEAVKNIFRNAGSLKQEDGQEEEEDQEPEEENEIPVPKKRK